MNVAEKSVAEKSPTIVATKQALIRYGLSFLLTMLVFGLAIAGIQWGRDLSVQPSEASVAQRVLSLSALHIRDARAEKERAEKERAEKERAEKERAEKERAEKERAEKERAEKERAEKERAEKERAEKERAEKERAEKERAEKERAEKERAEKERAEKERAEQSRLDRDAQSSEKSTQKSAQKSTEKQAEAKNNTQASNPQASNPQASNPQAIAAYQSGLRQAIERNKRYPRRASQARAEGRVVVAFTLGAQGDISGVRVVQSSGNRHLDKAAVAAVKKVGRYQPRPAGVTANQQVALNFALK
ncbi:cell envelope integrity protein TolA [Ostreibacterium oceani]|uniref:Protein TonB n=1 Tax=Ostreibacterium oceani TaxID=2654998 RepID=A0A6N7F1B6_9GAMM|nr:cell envelope integrity protein TolA [Ostreibacterium oceani]MPV85646.1 cell envelope integrity protein TolA [Ostreibacterium oceani]